MIPCRQDFDFYIINDLRVIHLTRSDGRRGYNDDGYAMFSYDGEPLGWIGDGEYLHECVTAELLVAGKLAPQWKPVPTGLRLLHPRYTMDILETSAGWVPTIRDELSNRSHSLKARPTRDKAVSVLDALLQRLVGRQKPSFDPEVWLGNNYGPTGAVHQFQLALEFVGPIIASMIRNNPIKPAWGRSPPRSALELAGIFDADRRFGIDPAPMLTTVLATYIKCALLDVYGGANSVSVPQSQFSATFTPSELSAFRARFKHSPLTDGDYLSLVDKNFTSQLQPLYRKRHRKKRGLLPLHPRRDKGDYPIYWPLEPGTRLFDPTDTLGGISLQQLPQR